MILELFVVQRGEGCAMVEAERELRSSSLVDRGEVERDPKEKVRTIFSYANRKKRKLTLPLEETYRQSHIISDQSYFSGI